MNGVANGLYGGDLPNQINTPWIDFSNQSIITGFSATTDRVIKYKLIGNIMFVQFGFIGTSNSANFNFTLPYPCKTAVTSGTFYVADNGLLSIGYVSSTVFGSSTFSIVRYSTLNVVTNTWTSSGGKQAYGQFFYEI